MYKVDGNVQLKEVDLLSRLLLNEFSYSSTLEQISAEREGEPIIQSAIERTDFWSQFWSLVARCLQIK